ncbi:hypothetical protein EVAR_95946_1 [Eumeta japonica]|uniref:Uncharacterized protein n=1 Tax=Eumeta variegata TaxID=151549 RepID=A0A4C1V8Y6_EUMVA|nr:hypothetical protein EVAR_95946_1 [Eumeta japonica]
MLSQEPHRPVSAVLDRRKTCIGVEKNTANTDREKHSFAYLTSLHSDFGVLFGVESQTGIEAMKSHVRAAPAIRRRYLLLEWM